jgi:hypothetical protein
MSDIPISDLLNLRHAAQFQRTPDLTFTLFAGIDIIVSVPSLISLKEKVGGFSELKATLISGGLMILFLYLGK